MDIKLEIMTLDHLEKIKDFLNTQFDDFWNYNILKEELCNQNSKYIVALNSENNIVGFAGFMILYDEADISNIVVHKNYRHLGIGTLMLNKLIESAKSLNLFKINLEVAASNINAINLYKKLSFEKCGLRKKYYHNTTDAILMKLNIN